MAEKNIPKELLDLCITQVINRFSGFSRIQDCVPVEVTIKDLPQTINHRSEIFLYGVDTTIRIQFFYIINQQVEILKNLYDDVNDTRVIDFYNELCNLTGGKVKEVLYEQNIVTALSLPVGIKTSREKVRVSPEVLNHVQLWNVEKNGSTLFSVKTSLEVHEPESFKDFDKDFKRSDIQDGDIDFL